MNLLTGDLLLPRLVVKRSALEHNIERMARFCAEHGLSFAPHAKTTMAPGILRRQLEAGAWGLTVATVVQAQALRDLGVRRILIANEVVEPRAIVWLAGELAAHADVELFVLADSLRGVSILESALAAAGAPRPLGVLVEIGETGGRAGCRTDGEALAVARAVVAADHLRLCGVEGFDAMYADVPGFLRRVRGLVETLAREGAFAAVDEVIVSAGSSEYYTTVAELLVDWTLDRPVRTLLRPGGYATFDSGPGFARPLEIWGAVVSRPEPSLAIAGFGRRDVPSAESLPEVTARAVDGRLAPLTGAAVTRLMDQHALIELGDASLEVGELVGCSIPNEFRPAFATWRTAPLVDDDYTVVETLDVLY
jgi:D-serine deaminase-like pyridoxal phosphate-dependent protein